MANKKISELAATATVLSAQELVINNAGIDEKVTFAQTAEFVGRNISNLYAGATYSPDNLTVGGFQIHSATANINPLQNSPNDSVVLYTLQANLDAGQDNFDLGDNGQSLTVLNLGYFYNNSIGSVHGYATYLNLGGQFGNGTDESTLKGFNFINGSFQVQAQALFAGQLLGYIFSPTFNAAASTDNTFSVEAFRDNAQLPVDVYGYTSLNSSPSIDTLKNNHNFVGINLNPTVTTLEGNAGVNLLYLGGAFTNMGTNGFTGIQCNSNIVHLTENAQVINVGGQTTDGDADWTGVNITTNDITTSGTVRGLNINVSPSDLPGSRAIDSQGHASIQVAYTLASGLGQAFGHQIGGSVTIPDATAVVGSDFFGNGMSFGIDLGDATSSWTAASLVGITTLGFVGFIEGDGDAFGAINFCLNGFADGHNGHIDRVNNFQAAAVPGGGIGTMDEHVLYMGDLPGGPIATDSWGIRMESPDLQNYMVSLALGTGNAKVSNDSVALELGGNERVLRHANLTTVEINALTALRGMEVYDTTLDQLVYYNGTVWVAV